MDEDQYFIEAAMRYEALLEEGRLVSIEEFVAGEPAHLRAELRAFLAYTLDSELDDTIQELTPQEQALAADVLAQARVTAPGASAPSPSTPMRTLVELRDAHDLSTRKLAQRVNLPVDLMAKIERGGVLAASIPAKLVARLAEALAEAEDAIRAALAGPQLSAAVKLSAKDGTTVSGEQPVAFAEALQRSAATPEQRTEWEQALP